MGVYMRSLRPEVDVGCFQLFFTLVLRQAFLMTLELTTCLDWLTNKSHDPPISTSPGV